MFGLFLCVVIETLASSYPSTYQKEMTKKISGKHLLQTIGCDLIFLGQNTLRRGKHVNHISDG